jgi:thiamine pyrophosphokinase
MESLKGGVQALPTDGCEVVTEWRPARLLSEHHTENGFALLILNQPLNNLDLLKLVWKKGEVVGVPTWTPLTDHSWVSHCSRWRRKQIAQGLQTRFISCKLNEGHRKHFLHYLLFCTQYIYSITCFPYSDVSQPLETILGDLDSLKSSTESWARSNNTIIAKDSSQDSTDFTKCISFIATEYLPTLPTPMPSVASPTSDILVLGGLGGRVDQSLSILHHLYKSPELYPQGRVYLLTTSAITFLLPAGVHRIVVKDSDTGSLGRHVGILPVGAPARITTSGLEWDVQNWETSFGGKMSTSNLVREDVVRVETTSGVLFTIDLKSEGEGDDWDRFNKVDRGASIAGLVKQSSIGNQG